MTGLWDFVFLFLKDGMVSGIIKVLLQFQTSTDATLDWQVKYLLHAGWDNVLSNFASLSNSATECQDKCVLHAEWDKYVLQIPVGPFHEIGNQLNYKWLVVKRDSLVQWFVDSVLWQDGEADRLHIITEFPWERTPCAFPNSLNSTARCNT